MPSAPTPYAQGFFRVAAGTPAVAPAALPANLAVTLELACAADLSPRADWRAPSDASVQVWLDQLAMPRRP